MLRIGSAIGAFNSEFHTRSEYVSISDVLRESPIAEEIRPQVFCPDGKRKENEKSGRVSAIGAIYPEFDADSEYATAPLRRRKIPIAAINNSEVVVTEFLKHRRDAQGVRSHFWFVEFSDYLFHRKFCDLILSPYPLRTIR